MNRLVILLLRILLGGIFIFSGIIKLFPIEPFELTFVEQGFFSWTLAPIVARLLISIEILLGVLIIIYPVFKGRIFNATILLLMFFTAYLIYAITTEGNKGNCGCFGTFLAMTPLESIGKNFTLIVLAVFVRYKDQQLNFKFQKPIVLFASICSFIVPYIIEPIDIVKTANLGEQKTGFKLEYEALAEFSKNDPTIDFENKNYIIAFLSLSCEHCKSAAHRFHVITKQVKTVPVLFVFLNGEPAAQEKKKAFDLETKSGHFPYIMLTPETFFKTGGMNLPALYYVEKGIVKKRWRSVNLNPEVLSATLSE